MNGPANILCPLLLICLLGSSCDSIEPSEENLFVVEGFLKAGAPLPLITITRARTLAESPTNAPVAIDDAVFAMYINNQSIPYAPSGTKPGKYAPVGNVMENVPPRAVFRAEIEWQSMRATTQDIVPPPITIDSVLIKIPNKPVAAVLLDTLRFDNPEVGARRGFIYPIDVTIQWTSDAETAVDSSYWIETRLIPQTSFSSTVLDVFLLSEEVELENKLVPEGATDGTLRRVWAGVYAVSVTDSLSPPPAHNLTVQLIRSTRAYADFAASRNIPERREPISNIDGAIGVLAGIALDSIAFEVENGLATARQ